VKTGATRRIDTARISNQVNTCDGELGVSLGSIEQRDTNLSLPLTGCSRKSNSS
jgi:hypothetical protein